VEHEGQHRDSFPIAAVRRRRGRKVQPASRYTKLAGRHVFSRTIGGRWFGMTGVGTMVEQVAKTRL
jgi:hypothetical protein